MVLFSAFLAKGVYDNIKQEIVLDILIFTFCASLCNESELISHNTAMMHSDYTFYH